MQLAKTVGNVRLGTVPRREREARAEKQDNRGERKIRHLRKEIKTLTELKSSEQLITIRRAERSKQRWKLHSPVYKSWDVS